MRSKKELLFADLLDNAHKSNLSFCYYGCHSTEISDVVVECYDEQNTARLKHLHEILILVENTRAIH